MKFALVFLAVLGVALANPVFSDDDDRKLPADFPMNVLPTMTEEQKNTLEGLLSNPEAVNLFLNSPELQAAAAQLFQFQSLNREASSERCLLFFTWWLLINSLNTTTPSG